MTDVAHDVWRWGCAMLRRTLLDDLDTEIEVAHLLGLLEADRLVGGTHGLGRTQDGRLQVPRLDLTQPLQSLFPTIFQDVRQDQPAPYYVPPTPLFTTHIPYPIAAEHYQGFAPALQRLQTAVHADLATLDRLTTTHPDRVSDDLLSLLLEKYGATLPSGVEAHLSLYDYLKLTAAVASCLATAEHTPECLLVAGDLSGIQDFVYTISSRGALKSLRGRSFFLEMLLEHAVDLLLEAAGMSRANVLYVGGGNMALLLPHCSNTPGLVSQLQQRLNAWLLQEFDGQLYLGMTIVPVPGEALRSQTDGQAFNAVWRQATQQLEEDKRRRFADQLPTVLAPVEPRQLDEPGECQICARHDVPEQEMTWLYEENIGDRVCLNCYRFFHIGGQLAMARAIVRRPGEPLHLKQVCLVLPGQESSYTYTVTYTVPTSLADLPVDADRVWMINSCAMEDYAVGLPVQPLLIEQSIVTCGDLRHLQEETRYGRLYARALGIEIDNMQTLQPGKPPEVQDDHTVSFAGLAATACGAQLIGALRMDVDHFGLIMAQGLSTAQRSLGHLAALSRQLSYFFKGYLNWICAGDRDKITFPLDTGELPIPLNLSQRLLASEQKQSTHGQPVSPKRMISVIYAGGDDLFLVGAWSDVAEVAYDIARCFQAYTCHQRKFVSLSAGMTVHHPTFPLAQIAQHALAALQQAKSSRGVPAGHCDCFRTLCPLYRSQEGICGEKSTIALLYNRVVEARAQRLKEQYTRENQPEAYRERIVNILNWDDSLKQTADMVSHLLELGTVEDGALTLQAPRTFLRRLLTACHRWHTAGVLYIPLLEWAYARVESALQRELPAAEEQAWTWVQGTLLPTLANVESTMVQGRKRPPLIASAHLPLMWVELLMRQQEAAER